MEKIKGSEQKFRRTLRGAALAVACVVAGGPAIAAEAAPLAGFGRLPTLEDVAISPDGSKLAFVKTDGDSRKLLVIRLGAKTEVIGGALVSNVKLREVAWIDDDNIVATVSSTAPPPFGFTGATREWFQLVNFDLTMLKIHALSFDIDNVETFNVITSGWTVRDVAGHPTLYTQGYCVREGTVPCLFAVTYPDRRVRLVDEAREPGTEWLLDAAGNIAAQYTYWCASWSTAIRNGGRSICPTILGVRRLRTAPHSSAGSRTAFG